LSGPQVVDFLYFIPYFQPFTFATFSNTAANIAVDFKPPYLLDYQSTFSNNLLSIPAEKNNHFLFCNHSHLELLKFQKDYCSDINNVNSNIFIYQKDFGFNYTAVK